MDDSEYSMFDFELFHTKCVKRIQDNCNQINIELKHNNNLVRHIQNGYTTNNVDLMYIGQQLESILTKLQEYNNILKDQR